MLSIKEEVAQAAGYFKKKAQGARSSDAESKDVLLELYNFAKEKRSAFRDRIEEMQDLIV